MVKVQKNTVFRLLLLLCAQINLYGQITANQIAY